MREHRSITSLETNRPWYYPACPKCNKRVPLNSDVYTCVPCEQTDTKYMYCITTTLSDNTGSLTATLFGNAVASLVGLSCYDMIKEHGHTDDSKMPKILHSIKGLTRIFQLEKGKRDSRGLRFAVNKVFEPASTSTENAKAGAKRKLTFTEDHEGSEGNTKMIAP